MFGILQTHKKIEIESERDFKLDLIDGVCENGFNFFFFRVRAMKDNQQLDTTTKSRHFFQVTCNFCFQFFTRFDGIGFVGIVYIYLLLFE